MPSSPDRFSAKRLWRRLAGDSNKEGVSSDMPGNSEAVTGNTSRRPDPAAGTAVPPLLVFPDSPGYAALALTLAPVAVWALVVWLSARNSSKLS